MLLQLTEKMLPLPPPTESGAHGPRKMSPTTFPPQIMDPGKFLLLPPPHRRNPFGQKSVCPPQWMLARMPMSIIIGINGRRGGVMLTWSARRITHVSTVKITHDHFITTHAKQASRAVPWHWQADDRAGRGPSPRPGKTFF